MGNILSINKTGKLRRIDNSLMFIENESDKKIKIPVLKISQIDIYSNVEFDSEILYFLSKNNIGINFFHHFTSTYFGEFNMWNQKNSDKLMLKQFNEYENNRLYYINKIYKGMLNNFIYLLSKYQKRTDIGKEITLIIKNLRNIDFQDLKYENYMLFEAKIWNIFYTSIPLIIQKKEFEFIKRTKRPPENKINSLISFINTKLYFTINSVIKSTKLDNRIGFIHELSENSRFSLVLDISEIFKPIFTFYFIFNNINNKIISENDFEKKSLNLSKDGLTKINKLYTEFLDETVHIEKLKRKVSYKHLIKLECYKLFNYHYLKEVD